MEYGGLTCTNKKKIPYQIKLLWKPYIKIQSLQGVSYFNKERKKRFIIKCKVDKFSGILKL